MQSEKCKRKLSPWISDGPPVPHSPDVWKWIFLFSCSTIPPSVSIGANSRLQCCDLFWEVKSALFCSGSCIYPHSTEIGWNSQDLRLWIESWWRRVSLSLCGGVTPSLGKRILWVWWWRRGRKAERIYLRYMWSVVIFWKMKRPPWIQISLPYFLRSNEQKCL